MDDRAAVAWLHRRIGFGLAPGELDRLAALGADAVLHRLLDPDAQGVDAAPDPWADLDLRSYDPTTATRDQRVAPIAAWLVAMASTPRPLHEWIRWFWHGHLVSTLRVVRHPALLVDQLRLFGERGLGDLAGLLRAVTIDPAMLLYLDGATNQRGAVNENYGRELLELFALGIGAYTEADVRAGATALTGWTVERGTGAARFVARRHDDTPQTYLGRSGVHDVDTVIDAVVDHPACAPFIAGRLARAILGPDVDAGLVDRLGRDFAAGGLQLRPLVQAILEAGLDGAGGALVQAPVPWLTSMVRATAAPVVPALTAAGRRLEPAGQVPMQPPSVAGWTGGRWWLTSSATVARLDMAAAVAAATPASSPPLVAAARADHGALASALGRPEGFVDGTLAGLREAAPAGARAVLAVAMAAPDVVLV